VRQRLAELRIPAEVTGRPKHLYSIYEKMVVKGREFDEIFDLVGMRVIVDSVKDCYAALGSIHATWKPVQGRFKDYIAMPKFNLYQSLHTTVIGPQGKPVEVQIRTWEMHARAEQGIAAHWAYKDREANVADMPWLNRIVDWQSETSDPDEFMQRLKIDLEQDEVFVFTPKGKVITLPVGATPIDFAYAIHTEVGHACIGAKVNGRLVPLDSKLQSGDTVEIFTSKVEGAGPSRDWLQIVATPRAASKIRQWFSRERREDAIESGREELMKALRREGLPVQKLQSGSVLTDTAKAMNYADLEALYAAIGEKHVSAQAVAARVSRALRDVGTAEEETLPTTIREPRRGRRSRGPAGVHVEGLDDVFVRLSRCCTPVPGDEIIGFVTRGRGVSVHRSDCANAVSLVAGQADRLIDVEWDLEPGGVFIAAIEVKAFDRARLLRDVTAAFADHHVNILTCTTQTGSDRVTKMRFDMELGDPSHLESLLSTIRGVESVYDAYRVVPGKGGS
jgi:GTP pyrophosphokinase